MSVRLPYATPRREIVRQCCAAALMWYRVFGDLSGSREWLDKARLWRDHYAREVEANNAFIRRNPEAAKRWNLVETAPCPEPIWTYEDNRHAFAQGWGVFDNTDHGTRVERVDDMEEITRIAGALPIFVCDADALAHVQGEADRGSEFHRRALAHIAACAL